MHELEQGACATARSGPFSPLPLWAKAFKYGAQFDMRLFISNSITHGLNEFGVQVKMLGEFGT